MTHPLHSRIISSILLLDDVDPLKLSQELAARGSQPSLAMLAFSVRCLDLAAIIRLARGGRGGPFAGSPLDHMPHAARCALSDPYAVATWVCAPLATLTTSDAQ